MPLTPTSESRPLQPAQSSPDCGISPACEKSFATHGDGFKRDRLTWFSYVVYGFWAIAWGLFAPLMPFLRGDLHLNYATASLHFSALAFGLLVAGLSGSSILAQGRPTRVIWAGTAVSACGLFLVSVASSHYLTIFAALLVGFGGSIAGQAMIASLSHRYQSCRAEAISELVMSNSMFAALTPLAVAAIIKLGLSWKAAICFPVILLALGCWLTRCGGGQLWHLPPRHATSKDPLPLAYWLYFGIIFLSVAAEWSISFWCPDYLEHGLHFSRADACSGLSVFLLAMLSGRVLGRRLSATGATNTLLIAAMVLASCGFFIFWCGKESIWVFAGLIILGLGQSNCYPLAFAAAIGSAGGKTAEATAKMSISTGSAILVAPLLLGLAADRFGIMQAYGVVAMLLILATIAAVCAASIMSRQSRP